MCEKRIVEIASKLAICLRKGEIDNKYNCYDLAVIPTRGPGAIL